MFALIPAYRPDDRLNEIVAGLAAGGGYNIVIVDDGSGSEYAARFNALCDEYPEQVTLLRNPGNLGKGAAIKTGLAFIKEVAAENEGVVTVNAEGQNTFEDIEAVTAAWQAAPAALHLGSYRYRGRLPFWRRLRSGFTRSIFAVSTGARVYNPHTGLRAFSVKYIEGFLGVKGERSDYEINQLLYAAKHHIAIAETPIGIDNIEGNRAGTRRTFKDSWLIYKMICIFMLSSFSSFLVDYSLLLILAAVFKGLPSAVETVPGEFRLPIFGMNVDTHLLALIIARAVSSYVNYVLNRKIVFKSKSRSSIFRYYIVIITLLAANYLLLSLVSTANGLPLWLAQLVVQAVLYPFSFILQRKFVFPTKEQPKESE